MIIDLPVKLNTYIFSADFYVVDMGGTNIVLGMAWLHTLKDMYLSTEKMEMRFIKDGQPQVLKAICNDELK